MPRGQGHGGICPPNVKAELLNLASPTQGTFYNQECCCGSLIHLVTQKAVSFEWVLDIKRALHQVKAAMVLGPWAVRSIRLDGIGGVSGGKRCGLELEATSSGRHSRQAFGSLEQGCVICSQESHAFWKMAPRMLLGPARHGTLDHRMLTELPIMN